MTTTRKMWGVMRLGDAILELRTEMNPHMGRRWRNLLVQSKSAEAEMLDGLLQGSVMQERQVGEAQVLEKHGKQKGMVGGSSGYGLVAASSPSVDVYGLEMMDLR